jgi:hypothetical protein
MGHLTLYSFIQTITVGVGISPDLLTWISNFGNCGARGFPGLAWIPLVGNFAPP